MDQAKILIADDQPELHRLLGRVFAGAELRNAYSGTEALEIAREWKPDIIISDHCMPGMTGVELLAILRDEQPDTMRVLISAHQDHGALVEAVNGAGIHQFIEKPFQLVKLRLTVESLFREQTLQQEKARMAQQLDKANRNLQEQQVLLEYLVERRTEELSHAKEELERSNSELTLSNSELEQVNRRLQESLTRDSLTGVFTRQYLNEHLKMEIARAERYERPLSLFFIDIDNFKTINDTLGHPIGDAVLVQFGQFFLSPACEARATDLAARYGGEEFVIVLPETARRGAVRKGERLRRMIRKFSWSDIHPSLGSVTASMGASFFPEDGRTPAELLAVADQRLYIAKGHGKDRLVVGGSGRMPRGTGSPPSLAVRQAPSPIAAPKPFFQQCERYGPGPFDTLTHFHDVAEVDFAEGTLGDTDPPLMKRMTRHKREACAPTPSNDDVKEASGPNRIDSSTAQ